MWKNSVKYWSRTSSHTKTCCLNWILSKRFPKKEDSTVDTYTVLTPEDTETFHSVPKKSAEGLISSFHLPFICELKFSDKQDSRSVRCCSAANLKVLNFSHRQHEHNIIIMALKKTKQKQRPSNGSSPRFGSPPKSNQLVLSGLQAKYICCFVNKPCKQSDKRRQRETTTSFWIYQRNKSNSSGAETRFQSWKHPRSRRAERCWEI